MEDSVPRPELDPLLRRPPPASVEQARALVRVEERLFGRPAKPVTLARYVLLERIGTGGEGAVFRASDPELDRKVAVKLLLAAEGDDAGEALLREAQALARLRHPNVVAVHDVGRYDERDLGYELGAAPRQLEVPPRGVFLVMELVEGPELGSWLRASRRPLLQILEVFAQAGRGLAAVHRAGLVHRDFKPRNVRVDGVGRVVVLDLGLARLAGTPGARLGGGTLPYLAPEQHRGESADVRADQFAFGVALFEALVGAPPFAGDAEALARAKEEGLAAVWPRAVPRAARAVLARLLAPRAIDRFPSMDAVVAELEAIGRRRRRRRAVAWGAAASLALMGATFVASRRSAPCDGTADPLAGIWDEPRRQALRARLLASPAPYAATTWQGVNRELEAHAQRWVALRRQACLDTRVARTQSEDVLDLQMACLDRHAAELRALVDTLLEPNTTIELAAVAVHGLGWLGACQDRDRLASRVSLPADAASREAVEAAYGELARAQALERAGRYDEAEARLRAVASAPPARAHPPLAAATAFRLGDVLERRSDFRGAEEALLTAVTTAEASRDDETAADALTSLVWVVGVEQRRPAEGATWSRLAAAAVERSGADRLRQASLLHSRGGLATVQGRREEALEHYTAALEIFVEMLGEDDPTVAMTLNHIGNVHMHARRWAQARPWCERSLAIRIRTLGADHPQVAPSLNNLAAILEGEGRCPEALTVLNRALAINRGSGRADELVSTRLVRSCTLASGATPEPQLLARLAVLERTVGEGSRAP